MNHSQIEASVDKFLFEPKHAGFEKGDWRKTRRDDCEHLTYDYIRPHDGFSGKTKPPRIIISGNTIQTDPLYSGSRHENPAIDSHVTGVLSKGMMPLGINGQKRRADECLREQQEHDERVRQRRLICEVETERELIAKTACTAEVKMLAAKIAAGIKAHTADDETDKYSVRVREEVLKHACDLFRREIQRGVSETEYGLFSAQGKKTSKPSMAMP